MVALPELRRQISQPDLGSESSRDRRADMIATYGGAIGCEAPLINRDQSPVQHKKGARSSSCGCQARLCWTRSGVQKYTPRDAPETKPARRSACQPISQGLIWPSLRSSCTFSDHLGEQSTTE